MNWIRTKDKLPEDCESVLIWSKGMTPVSAYLSYGLTKSQDKFPLVWTINDWHGNDFDMLVDEVSHWMPLPEDPK